MLSKLLKKLPSKLDFQLFDVGYPFCKLLVKIAVDEVTKVFTDKVEPETPTEPEKAEEFLKSALPLKA